MNVSTMHNKLLRGEYKNPLQFIDDARLYNNKPLRVYKMCTKLAKLFVESIDRVVQELGYCCDRQYAYLPKLMLCYEKQQCWEIPSYGCYYYYYSNSEPSRFNLTSGKYTFCANCFHSIKSESILIGDDSTQTIVEIPKQIFLLAQNDIREPEIMIVCIVCTRLADNNHPYRTKVIFAFQKIENVDVVFFGMYTQEYAECCPVPNTYRVYIYISYLDTVHFFRPKLYHQHVYHEILIGYLDNVKQHGYMYAHIWDCPANEGVDYIFCCRPPEQLLSKLKRLQDWCRKMLDKAIAERLV
ncbi:unnamed protein product, partial [Rotaria sp. Silwood2]